MPKSTPEQFIDAVIAAAGSYCRADASEQADIIKEFYRHYSAHISTVLSDTQFSDTLTLLATSPLGQSEKELLTGLKLLLEEKAANASASSPGILIQWKNNLDALIKNIHTTPRSTFFAPSTPSPTNTTTSSTSLAGKHRHSTSG